jgi:CelD/BcsL family acetyltransferase involved in cellulose biosynthesis
VIVLVGYKDLAPVFFLPLQQRTGLLGRLGLFEPAGGVMTDYFGMVAKGGVQIEISELLAATSGIVNAVFFTHLDETQARYGLKVDDCRAGLRTRLGSPPQEYWNRLRMINKKLVYDTERRERKLIGEWGPISFEWSSMRPQADLAWLITSKRSQYKRTGKEQAPLFSEGNVTLLQELLESKDEGCSGLLSVLRCGEDIIASHFGLRCHEMIHVWFPVYDERFANHSPGRILFKYMFAAAAEQGVTVFDRGEGDNQAKRDFANDQHRFGRGFWVAEGGRGALARLAQRIAWRVSG